MASDVSPQWARAMVIVNGITAKAVVIPLIGCAVEGKPLGILAGSVSLGLSVWQINHWLRKEGDLR